MPRNYVDKDFERERLVHQYIQALDQGDTDAIAVVLEAALDDPELDRIIEEIHLSYQEELQLPSTITDAEVVRELVHKYLPSAFKEQEVENELLTVGEVAAYLQAKGRILAIDKEANVSLLNSTVALPEELNVQAIKQLASELGIKASDRYWRSFRDTAIALEMGRGQMEAQLMAARKKRTQRNKRADQGSGVTSTTDSFQEERP
jgi:hypothetical protein